MRLTKDIVQKILDMNEGFSRTTSYSSRNFQENRQYLIKEGKLLIEAIGKTSWADSRYNNKTIADIDQTRRFINKYLAQLKLDGLF